jgi:hypothetical protein
LQSKKSPINISAMAKFSFSFSFFCIVSLESLLLRMISQQLRQGFAIPLRWPSLLMEPIYYFRRLFVEHWQN